MIDLFGQKRIRKAQERVAELEAILQPLVDAGIKTNDRQVFEQWAEARFKARKLIARTKGIQER